MVCQLLKEGLVCDALHQRVCCLHCNALQCITIFCNDPQCLHNLSTTHHNDLYRFV